MEEVKEVTNNEILEALNNLNDNSVATNNSIKELTEYLIIKDREQQQKEATEKKQAEQEAQEAEVLKEQEAKESESALAEQSAKADAQTETYTEILSDIRDEVRLTNNMFAGQFLFIGIMCGVLLFKILWDKLT